MSFLNPTVTRLWRPLMGTAQGSIARIAEEFRRAKWDDRKYVAEDYYGLSLRSSSSSQTSPGGVATFIFPVGPQSVRVSRQYRQAITPTLGGLVAEERGILWRDINIEGNFGLQPKFGYDTTLKTEADFPVAAPWQAPLSGPRWTQRMFAHFLDRYAEMKAKPDENYATTLVWHNFKDDEHWIVVPIKADMNRTINDRMMYPFSLTFRAIAPTSAVTVIPPPPTVATVIAAAQNAARVARLAVSTLTDATNTVTAALGQVRSFAATIDSVVDEMNRAKNACLTMVESGSRLGTDIGGMFMRSATELTEVVMKEADASVAAKTGFPEEVRQSLYKSVDSYDSLGAVASLQTNSSLEERVTQATANQQPSATAVTTGAATASAGSSRPFSKWAGWVTYVVRSGDTLRNIAAREVGDPSRWYEIAVQNGLQAPYISVSGLPGTVHVGDTIMIPAAVSPKKSPMASAADDISHVGLYGRDIMVYETTGSRPGRTQVDLQLDLSNGKDVAAIAGIPNLVQACQMRLWTEQGTHMLDPSYGTPFVVGYPNVGATIVALKSAIRAGLIRDSRIESITSMIVSSEDDMVDVDATVVPVGTHESLNIGIVAL